MGTGVRGGARNIASVGVWILLPLVGTFPEGLSLSLGEGLH